MIFRHDLYVMRTYQFFSRIQIIQIELIFSIYQRLEIFLLAACYGYYFDFYLRKSGADGGRKMAFRSMITMNSITELLSFQAVSML